MKFYKTTITLEVLSEDKPAEPEGFQDLARIVRECLTGDYSGKITSDVKQLSLPQCAEELIEQGSDPGFFGLNEDGDVQDE